LRGTIISPAYSYCGGRKGINHGEENAQTRNKSEEKAREKGMGITTGNGQMGENIK
jgi:hypothetical protein